MESLRNSVQLTDDSLAFEVAEIARFSSEEVQAYENSLKSYRDLKNSLDTAFEEGREEEKRQVVKSSVKAGLEVDTISMITGLSPEEIERIKSL